MKTTQKKLLIIDDHAVFADGLALILNTIEPVYDIVVATEVEEFVKDHDRLSAFDAILVDLFLPNLDGFAFLDAVRLNNIDTPVLVISGSEKKADIEKTIAKGAAGFVPKTSNSEDIKTAIDMVIKGGRYLPERYLGEIDWVVASSAFEPQAEELTRRQYQVLKLINEGLKNREIASVLNVTESAVKNHVENLFRVFNVKNRTSCLRSAKERGVILD